MRLGAVIVGATTIVAPLFLFLPSSPLSSSVVAASLSEAAFTFFSPLPPWGTAPRRLVRVVLVGGRSRGGGAGTGCRRRRRPAPAPASQSSIPPPPPLLPPRTTTMTMTTFAIMYGGGETGRGPGGTTRRRRRRRLSRPLRLPPPRSSRAAVFLCNQPEKNKQQ
jgi:hypothetical protein